MFRETECRADGIRCTTNSRVSLTLPRSAPCFGELMVPTPTKEEIKTYLDTFFRLARFESLIKRTRRWGVFKDEEFEAINKDCERVKLWLESLLEG